MSQSIVWEPVERAGLRQSSECEHHLISVPFNPDDEEDGRFDLYYFYPKAGSEIGGRGKNVLFCAGGPGEMLIPGDDELWLTNLTRRGYKVVFFHLRGSGFSQIPASNKFDRFIRTKYAVRDLEEIRRQELDPGETWDAVVGYSYGTVLAQQYARYAMTELREPVMKNLLLIGPLSMHPFAACEKPRDVFDDYTREVEQIRRQVIEKIYGADGASRGFVRHLQVVMDELFGVQGKSPGAAKGNGRRQAGIFNTIETQFGSESFIVENYEDLKKSGLLRKHDLSFSPEFFDKLRSLRGLGWNPLRQPQNVMEDLEEVGHVFVQELTGTKARNASGKKAVTEKPDIQRSQRDYDVIGVYDGISRGFLREWLGNGRQNFEEAVVDGAGAAHVNEHIKKIGIGSHSEQMAIKAWDPVSYKHDVPTVIIRGTADPVTAGGQAERYHEQGLTGWRYLLELEGVGHKYILPQIKTRGLTVEKDDRNEFANPVDLIVASLVELNRPAVEHALRQIGRRLRTGGVTPTKEDRKGSFSPSQQAGRRKAKKSQNPLTTSDVIRYE